MSGILQSNLQNGIYSNDNAVESLANDDFMIGDIQYSQSDIQETGGGTLTVRANRNSSLTCIVAGTANNNYNGQLVATLGY